MSGEFKFDEDSYPKVNHHRHGKKNGFLLKAIIKHTPVTNSEQASVVLLILLVLLVLSTVWYVSSRFFVEPEYEITNQISAPPQTQ